MNAASLISIGNASQSQPADHGNPGPQAALPVEFAAKAGGTTYSANVHPIDGGFEARVTELPGASTTGQTVQQVENKLGNLINFFA